MVRINNFVETLRQYALQRNDSSQQYQYQVVAGLIRGNEIFNISVNQGHRFHAETAAIRNVARLCEYKGKGKVSTKDRSVSHPSH